MHDRTHPRLYSPAIHANRQLERHITDPPREDGRRKLDTALSERLTNWAKALATFTHPGTSSFDVTSAKLADKSLTLSVGTTGESKFCDGSSIHTFVNRGRSTIHAHLDAAIADTRANLASTGQGQSGELQVDVADQTENEADGYFVDVTYSLISQIPEPNVLSDDDQEKIKAYTDAPVTDAEIEAQLKRMGGAGSDGTGSKGGSTQM